MAQQVADKRDIEFVLHEQLNVEELCQFELFETFNKKTVNLILSEARNLAIKELLPCLKEADEEGCILENGKVTVPKVFHRALEVIREGEWMAMSDDPEWGGQGMPASVALAAANYFNGANYPFMMHCVLTHGAAKLVETFGTKEQKETYLRNMFTGKWGGTMLLTEPEAGSDVGSLTTTAVKNADGTYSITGNKIFISCGETDLVENIVHPVLARLEGAPQGTAGISLFLVPKYRVNPDGTLGEHNDIVCTGIEEKMGIHGSPTCSMALGSKGNCIGTILGEENKGMSAMFVMMNEARLFVGMQGFGCASASYLNALNYARQRVQGKALGSPKDAPSVTIVNHPDVKRMLLTMKAYTEGMRSILFYVGLLEDLHKVSASKEDKDRYQGLIDVLIPVSKGYVTDRSFDVCCLGVHTFGGYGFTKEYPQEQLLRDCKITQIYEGTNGIQAMDFLGRKLSLNKGASMMALTEEIEKTIQTAAGFDELSGPAAVLKKAVKTFKETAMAMGAAVASKDVLNAFANACPFLDVAGDTIVGWMLLWRATAAAQALSGKPKKKDLDFYDGQLKSARFFINTILPVSMAKMEVLKTMDATIMEISDTALGPK